MKFYLVYKNNGLYDPVLDDSEPLFDLIDQEDFDQPSRPTEVQFEPKEFTDLPQINQPNCTEVANLTQSRALTESPFLIPTKPYRPFSTEPLDVPPLEEPIILNPEYQDVFSKFGDLEEFLPTTRFKLPISEQYDPDGKRKNEGTIAISKEDVKVQTAEVKEEINQISVEKLIEATATEVNQNEISEEVQFMEKMRQELDLNKIEVTATNIVDESIEKAMTVAEEIKKEIDVELSVNMASELILKTDESKSSQQISVDKISETVDKKKDIGIKSEATEIVQFVELTDKTAEVEKTVTKAEVSVCKEATRFDKQEEEIRDSKILIKQELDETIEVGSVKAKSIAFDKEAETKESKVFETMDIEKVKSNQESKGKNQRVQNEDTKSETLQSTAKVEERKTTSDTKISMSRLLAEQKAYTIGLQTIPNIRGTVHSSYHYDLLLKTFFIHLTDVMVALSRFILAEPVISNTKAREEERGILKEEKVIETVRTNEKMNNYENIKETKHASESAESKIRQIHTKKEKNEGDQTESSAKQVTEVATEKTFDGVVIEKKQSEEQISKTFVCENHFSEEYEDNERRLLSGSEMAQLSERKSGELMNKMGSVITEFQNKAGIEETVESRERRSRSRSKVQEIIQGDGLELLSKVDSRKKSQERTESKIRTDTSNSISESTEITDNIDSKTTYIAIVEAHVYTNKDAILNESVAEISEISSKSLQNVEKRNIALEAIETIGTEKIASEHLQVKEEVAKTVIEKAREISTKTASKNEKAEKIGTQMIAHINQEVSQVEVEPNKFTILKQEIIETPKPAQVIIEEDIRMEQALVDLKSKAIEEKVQKVDIEELAVIETAQVIIEEERMEQALIDLKSEVIEEKVQELPVKETVVEKIVHSVPEVQEIKLSVTQAIDAVIVKEEFSAVEDKQKTVATEESTETNSVVVDVFREEVSHLKQDTSLETIQKVVEAETNVVKFESTSDTTTTTEETEVLKEADSNIAIKEDYISTVQINEIDIKAEKDQYEELKVNNQKVRECLDITEELNTTRNKTEIINVECKTEEVNDTEVNQSFKSDHVEVILNKTGIVDAESKMEERTEHNYAVQEDIQESSFTAKVESELKESTFVAKSASKVGKLTLRTDLAQETKLDQVSVPNDENNNTPSPTPVLPTPLTDEYIFKLEIALPKGITPVPPDPRSPTPESDEDPHIVKKKLIPNIETNIENGIIYDPPLPTPPGSKVTSPVGNKVTPFYTKPGLRGGADRRETKKEEILEIERKSSLLASAIDQTIKSIEEYKEEVGIETKKEVNTQVSEAKDSSVVYNGYAKILENKIYDTVEQFVDDNTEESKNLVSNVDVTVPENNVTDFAQVTDIEDINSQIAAPVDIKKFITKTEEEKRDPMEGYRTVQFDPAEIQAVLQNLRSAHLYSGEVEAQKKRQMYMTENGEMMGTHQGIVDGLDEAVVNAEIAKELGKPGMTEEKIAELISGESEMLREAHVMGLTRVLASHMSRPDDCSVDFKRIKPIVESLKDSEVLKALNDEILKTREERKKEERKWTTFMQKPKRPVPRIKFGYHGYVDVEEEVKEPYKVKIVKQPKPKVAPDYKAEDFETGLLPWEERALREPSPPPIEAEDPILVPEEAPEILEAVDPLPESEVPDLEDSGIPLPPPKTKEETPPPEDSIDIEEVEEVEAVAEDTENIKEENQVEEMDQNLAEQLMTTVQNMIDPNASLEQQLAQMRAQLAALAQLPCVIQQSLELVTRQLSQLSQFESTQMVAQSETIAEVVEENEASEIVNVQEISEDINTTESEEKVMEIEEIRQDVKPTITAEELERMRAEEEEMLEEQRRLEKQRKELMEQARLEHESRQIKQRPTPRVGKPKPVFGPATPQERPLVLPGGRKWRKPKDAYNEQFFTETLAAQAELIQGKTKGINFMKYEKPPVSLDHLQNSDVYKMVHSMDQTPLRRVDMLTPVLAEVDYREKCRSVTPCSQRVEEHLDIPQQVQP